MRGGSFRDVRELRNTERLRQAAGGFALLGTRGLPSRSSRTGIMGPERRGPTPGLARGRREGVRLLAELLLRAGLLVELGGLVVGGDHAEGLLQELAGLQAVGPGVALRLHGGLAGR